MFNVSKITPVYSVETSKKRIVLYEPQGDKNVTAEELANQFRENAIRSITDNSVKQPTTYNMDIIVPFQPIGRYVMENIKIFSDTFSGFADLVCGNDNIGTDVFEGIFASDFAYMKTGMSIADIAGRFPNMNGVSYININSLEAMAESCRLLCMKMWTGHDYKFVEITNMTHEKRGTEDDVFRASVRLLSVSVTVLLG